MILGRVRKKGEPRFSEGYYWAYLSYFEHLLQDPDFPELSFPAASATELVCTGPHPAVRYRQAVRMTSISDDDEEWARMLEGPLPSNWDEAEGLLLSPLEDAVNQAELAIPSDVTSQHDCKILEPLLENYAQAMTSSTKPPGSQPVSCSTYLPHQCMNHLKEVIIPGDPSRAFKGVGTGPEHTVLHKGSNRVARREKRPRSPHWSAEEKCAYLNLKVEALAKVKGKDWDFISQGLWEGHGFERSPKRCEQLWGTLRKAYRTILEHESLKDDRHPQRSSWVSYWEMNEDERSRINKQLPKVFPPEWNNMMEVILTEQKNRSKKKCRDSSPVQDQFIEDEDNDQSYYTLLADPLGESNLLSLESQVQPPLAMTHEEMPNLKYGRKGSKGNIEELQIKHQVEGVVDSALQRLGYRKNSRATRVEDGLLTMLSSLVKHQVEEAVNSALQSLVRIGEHDILASSAPVLQQWMKDALSSSLQPVSSTLQAVQNQGELEDQARLRVIEERRQALDLEEMQIKRKRVSRHQRAGRISSKQQGLCMKGSIAEGVIPT